MTREQMARHEEWISRPVSELFPRRELGSEAKCRHCREPFIRPRIQGGKARLYCSERCRDAHASNRAPHAR
jgi:formylmethanofuran dehydrogenase subunit E